MGSGDTTHLTFLLRLRDRADELSWEEFHARYGQLLYRYARSRGASHDDAEDVVQDVEMYVFKALDGFEYDARRGRFRAYLWAAVVNALARRASKQARQPRELDPQKFDYVAAQEQAAAPTPAGNTSGVLHRLRRAMSAIAGDFEPITLKAFEMHVLAGRPVAETADKLGLSPASVYQAKSRVLRSLKRHLAETTLDEDA